MRRMLATAAALLLGSLPMIAGASTTPPTPPELGSDDPALQQQVLADEEIRHERVVLEAGHIDLGPRLVAGDWRLLARDDTAALENGKPVWRELSDVVLRVRDQAILELPDDPLYAFTGAQPGERVWVVPQTEVPGVVWLGWSTQHPEVVSAIQRGVTMRFERAQRLDGDGRMSLFIQPGNFAEPQVLFDGSQPADVWVDLNTHTHANWVFTAAGTYAVDLKILADGVDGQPRSADARLIFAVGDETDAQAAFPAQPSDTPSATASGQSAASEAPAAEPTRPAANNTHSPQTEPASPGNPTTWIVGVAVGVVATAAIVGFILIRRRQGAIERAVFDE